MKAQEKGEIVRDLDGCRSCGRGRNLEEGSVDPRIRWNGQNDASDGRTRVRPLPMAVKAEIRCLTRTKSRCQPRDGSTQRQRRTFRACSCCITLPVLPSEFAATMISLKIDNYQPHQHHLTTSQERPGKMQVARCMSKGQRSDSRSE